MFPFTDFGTNVTFPSKKLKSIAEGVALTAWLVFVCLMIQRSDEVIVDTANKRALAFLPTSESSMSISNDELRVSNIFISDTLPRLMKLGLITKYERNESTTALLVAGRVWKKRTRFVKESLLLAVATYNRVNGLSAWTLVLDDQDGTMYAQVLPSNRREVYD